MVYKGCEKRMIMLKNTGSELFEEAYFILNSKKSKQASTSDMIKEANRIVAENSFLPKMEERGRSPFFLYLLGLLSGIGVTALIMTFVI